MCLGVPGLGPSGGLKIFGGEKARTLRDFQHPVAGTNVWCLGNLGSFCSGFYGEIEHSLKKNEGFLEPGWGPHVKHIVSGPGGPKTCKNIWFLAPRGQKHVKNTWFRASKPPRGGPGLKMARNLPGLTNSEWDFLTSGAITCGLDTRFRPF